MRRFAHAAVAAAAVVGFMAVVLLASCTSADRFDAGRPITKDELASISADLFTDVPSPATSPDEAESYPPGTVHWTAGGSVYHLDPDCYHLHRAETVLHGTVDEAAQNGKEAVCSSCGEP